MERGLISVDRWIEGSQVYFLTHLHADHTQGLSPKWKNGPLFCSQVSASLFPAKFPGFQLSLLRVLEIGSPHSLSLTSSSSGSQIKVQVTALDALHCPGAVMYLFRGEFGCMLYTGDFRWDITTDRAQIAKFLLLDALGGDEVNFLHLDNTYCNPSFSFPPREVASQQVIDIIASHPDHDIVIGIDTLGKEDLLLHISHTSGTKIWVWPERLQIMHLLGFGNIFTTKTCLTRVRAVPRYSLTVDTLEALNTIRPTIGIMPSGLPWGINPLEKGSASQGSSLFFRRGDKLNGKSFSPQKLHGYIYSVAYSDHSCFSELLDFVKLVRPANLSGIVSSSFCYINPRHYFSHLFGEKQQLGQSLKKLQRSDVAENAEVIPTKSVLGCAELEEPKRHDNTMKIACLRVRKSRVSILRRESRGVKIA